MVFWHLLWNETGAKATWFQLLPGSKEGSTVQMSLGIMTVFNLHARCMEQYFSRADSAVDKSSNFQVYCWLLWLKIEHLSSSRRRVNSFYQDAPETKNQYELYSIFKVLNTTPLKMNLHRAIVLYVLISEIHAGIALGTLQPSMWVYIHSREIILFNF